MNLILNVCIDLKGHKNGRNYNPTGMFWVVHEYFVYILHTLLPIRVREHGKPNPDRARNFRVVPSLTLSGKSQFFEVGITTDGWPRVYPSNSP